MAKQGLLRPRPNASQLMPQGPSQALSPQFISWFQKASEDPTGEKTALWPGHRMRAVA